MEPGALVQVYSAKRGDNLLCGSQLCLTINSVWSGYSPLRVEGYSPAAGTSGAGASPCRRCLA